MPELSGSVSAAPRPPRGPRERGRFDWAGLRADLRGAVPDASLALLATGFLSFGLWVHHMFATGLPQMSLSFFSAASMAVAIPSGIQVFAWIATIASGRLRLTAMRNGSRSSRRGRPVRGSS